MLSTIGFNLAHTQAASNLSFGIQNVNQARLGLANQATGTETPQQTTQMAGLDKALTLQGENAKVMFQATQAMQEASGSMLKKYWEQRQKNIQNGYIFG